MDRKIINIAGRIPGSSLVLWCSKVKAWGGGALCVFALVTICNVNNINNVIEHIAATTMGLAIQV